MLEDLTVVVPFWNGHATLGRLLKSLPSWLPAIVVDDHSDAPLSGAVQPPEKGYFSGAVNYGLDLAGDSDVLVLNQDLWFESDRWVERLARLRDEYAVIGDGVTAHPAWPKGYVQGTFMFLRRDAIRAVGGLNAEEYPLWGATCEWQLRACRMGFRAHVSREWRRWYAHDGRHGSEGRQRLGRRRRYGAAITEALQREKGKARLFLRTPPAISVVVPCYNYGRYLEDAVHSLIGGDTSLGRWEPPGQTFQSFEVIIVDDASTDGSWDAAREIADAWKGVRAVRLAENRGTPGAINAGIARAYGEYVHILSADDMREPWGLEVLYQGCREVPQGVAYGDVRVFKHGERARMLKLPAYNFDLVLNKNPMPAGILYPRQAWLDVGGYPENMIYGREDWAFNIALGLNGWCGHHVGTSGNLYRREGQNRSLRTGNRHTGEEGSGFSWRQTFKDQLRALYPGAYRGERPMRCCGGGRSNKERAAALPEAQAAAAGYGAGPVDPGTVWLEYVGGNAGNSYWWGPETGTRYKFGGGRRVGRVRRQDAPGMLDLRKGRKAVFRPYVPAVRSTKAAAKAVPVPQAQAAVANPPAPDDLTEIRGVGRATAAKLLAAGYATFLELARTAPEVVAEKAGLSARVAAQAVTGAREMRAGAAA